MLLASSGALLRARPLWSFSLPGDWLPLFFRSPFACGLLLRFAGALFLQFLYSLRIYQPLYLPTRRIEPLSIEKNM
ncbi:MAG: hypothetical protein ACLSGG_06705 [[Clostridium] leptum]